jgi:hypothetical protein
MKNHISNLLFSRYHIKKLLPIHSSCLDPFQTYYRMVHILVWTYFTEFWLVRDSSAVRRLFSTCCSHGKSESSTYAEQRICPPTLGQHISTFRGYLILFSIRNPYIHRFTNHFSIHSKPSYPQKVVLQSITARFCLRSYDSAICLPFFKHLSHDYEKTTITAMYHGRWFAYKQTNKYLYWQSTHLLRQNN